MYRSVLLEADSDLSRVFTFGCWQYDAIIKFIMASLLKLSKSVAKLSKNSNVAQVGL